MNESSTSVEDSIGKQKRLLEREEGGERRKIHDDALAQTSEIKGQWKATEEGIRRDEDAKLIRRLTGAGGRFHELATTGGGWETLYRDPTDGRLWEKTFPEGHLHGGGPPLLRVLSETEAQEKYGSAAFAPTR